MMDYGWYVGYHLRGDAGVEERVLAAIARRLALDARGAFRLVYHYATCYRVEDALRLLEDPGLPRSRVRFRTDRRYVRCNGAFERMQAALAADGLRMLDALTGCRTTAEQYRLVSSWYFFGRYAAYLFLEAWNRMDCAPRVADDLEPGWEEGENYTRGAWAVCRASGIASPSDLLRRARRDTGDDVFALETSLCAVEKIRKGTRWDGYYTERLLDEVRGTPVGALVVECLS